MNSVPTAPDAPLFRSLDPATGECVWEGAAATPAQCAAAYEAARASASHWAQTPLHERIDAAERYAALLDARRTDLAQAISRETGKALWESHGEVTAMIGKVAISIAAYAERTGGREAATDFGRAVLRHRPHGVMAVFGPYNFPGHLPNGHIVPALIAGNCVIFKPSELTPLVGQIMAELWALADLPKGVFNLVQGGQDTGAAILAQDIDGLLFTGSARAGAHFRRLFADRPSVILALELGGNNPLIAWDGEAGAIASIVIQSAFVTTGQRCSCARRLVVPAGPAGEAIVQAIAAQAARLRIGAWNDPEEPYMGPLISVEAAQQAHKAIAMIEAAGARRLTPTARFERSEAYIAPTLLEVTGIAVPDEEIFAPVLRIARATSFAEAIRIANATRFGLSAGLISDDDQLWQRFRDDIRAGVVNRNRPTTGAASNMPFGGLGDSGNHRPSAYYAADYCAYPMSSFEAPAVSDQSGAFERFLLPA